MLGPIAVFAMGCLFGNSTMLVAAIVAAPFCPLMPLARVKHGQRSRLRRMAKAQDERRLSEPLE